MRPVSFEILIIAHLKSLIFDSFLADATTQLKQQSQGHTQKANHVAVVYFSGSMGIQ